MGDLQSLACMKAGESGVNSAMEWIVRSLQRKNVKATEAVDMKSMLRIIAASVIEALIP